MAETNLLKWLYGKRGSGSSRKNSFSAPVMTWTSSHWPSSRSSSSAWTQHMHLSSAGSREQCCLGCKPWGLQPGMGCWFYRDRPCSAASEWQPGFRSLCKAHRCPDLQNKEMLPVTAQKESRGSSFQSCPAESTSFFHRSDTFFHKTWDRGPLLCTQCGQMAAKHIVCEGKKTKYYEEQCRWRRNSYSGWIEVNQNHYNCKKWVKNQLMVWKIRLVVVKLPVFWLHLGCIPSPWPTAAWDASSGTSSAWSGPVLGPCPPPSWMNVWRSVWRLKSFRHL